MRTAAPPLLPIFRSKLQGELLAALLLNPEREESLTELAARLGADVATVQREVSRLERAGILKTRRVGATRLASADARSPISAPLTEITLKTFGPGAVLAAAFSTVGGIDEIYIFGSWAARYLGVKGPQPQDLDVLVVGSPERAEVYAAALRVEHRLGLPVNPTIRSSNAWRVARDGFVTQLRSAPLVRVAHGEAS
ncbi:MAG: helix-turn-helix domain-containing protein [Actinomycetota bacterium]